MRDYGKVYSTFWSSPTTAPLSDDGKILALYLLTCAHSTIAGIFRLPDGYVSEDLGWPVERVQKGLAELLSNGFANRCDSTKWLWVTKHFEWNRPDNPNQRKSAAKVAQGIPDDCAWKPVFMRVCGPLLGLGEGEDANPRPTVAEPSRNQKQKQKQEQEQEQKRDKGAIAPSSPAGPATPVPTNLSKIPTLPDCPHRELIAMFVAAVPEMPRPRVEMWSGKNADAMRARWKWVLTARREAGDRYATSSKEALDWFGRFFKRVAASDFLCGRAEGRSKFTLGWLMRKENFDKVVEHGYPNREAA